MKLNIEKIFLEGPDLSGKTSLYESIHKKTNFSWNIQDRSALSMVCYASQYGRDEKNHRRSLYKELTNLNNRVIVLLPSPETLISRLSHRGDDFQSKSSLLDLYNIFEKESSAIEGLPNVLVIRESDALDKMSDRVIRWLAISENVSSESLGDDYVANFLRAFEKKECTLTYELVGNISKSFSKKILDDEKEGVYFKKIRSDFRHIVEKELLGLNEYNVPQDMKSRRFYYSSRTCISSLHFKPRGETLEFLCTLRSTNALENGSLDTQFLEFLVHDMGNEYFSNCKDYRITVFMNSAHLIEV